MRTIKFKAKRQDNGQWVTGDLLQHLDGDVLIGDNTGPWTDCGYSHCDYNQLYKVDPETVCQFTGLTDRNGKEIYEGDVLRSDIYPFSNIEYNERDNYFAVIYHCKRNASFLLQKIKNPKTSITGISDDLSDYITQEEMAEFEVIGSIHNFRWKQYRRYF